MAVTTILVIKVIWTTNFSGGPLNYSFWLTIWSPRLSKLFSALRYSIFIILHINRLYTIVSIVCITGYGHSTNRPGHHGTVVARTVGGVATLWYSNASCHPHSLENATHLAGTGVQVLIYMGQMQPASSSVGWSVDTRCNSHTDFHLQQKIEYKSGFRGNGYKKVVYRNFACIRRTFLH